MQHRHIHALDSLRGLAALLVVLYHLPPWHSGLYGLGPVRNGGEMVDFFFVLSGFVLTLTYRGRLVDRAQLRDFVVLRLGRVYPLHLTFLIPFAAIELSKVQLGHASAAQSPDLGAFVESLLMVHALGFSGNDAVFNFPSWSISTEFYTYLVFAGCLMLGGVRGFRLAAGLIAAASLGALLFGEQALGPFRWWVRCLAGFNVGCLSALVLPWLAARARGEWLAVAGLGLLLVYLAQERTGLAAHAILPISVMVVLGLAIASEGRTSRLLARAWLRTLGELSYALYMAHALVLWIARQACRALLHAPEVVVDGKLSAQLPPLTGLVVSATSVGAALALAWLVHGAVEKPSREWVRDYVKRLSLRAPLARGGGVSRS